MNLNTVNLYIQDFNGNEARDLFTPREDLNRSNLFSYKTELSGEDAAEEAFHLTNIPSGYLTDDQKEKVEGYKFSSLSVGDIVEVNDEKFLCMPSGWKILKS